jgi:putative addiction module component (TIGR02574 family)
LHLIFRPSELIASVGQLDSGDCEGHFPVMSTKQLTAEAMALPIAEKVSLAQALWQSIDAGMPDSDERAAVREAVRRDKELSAGTVVGLSHAEAMKAARRAIGCK